MLRRFRQRQQLVRGQKTESGDKMLSEMGSIEKKKTGDNKLNIVLKKRGSESILHFSDL